MIMVHRKLFSSLTKLILACFQSITLGGIVNGNYLYRFQFILTSVVMTSKDDISKQFMDERVDVLSLSSYLSFFLGWMIFGSILDNYGHQICSIVGIVSSMLGITLLALNQRYSFVSLLAVSFISFGGVGVQLPLYQISNLFPDWKSTILAILFASYQLSYFIFFSFHRMSEYTGQSYPILFKKYILISILNIPITMYLWHNPSISIDNHTFNDVYSIEMNSIYLNKVTFQSNDVHNDNGNDNGDVDGDNEEEANSRVLSANERTSIIQRQAFRSSWSNISRMLSEIRSQHYLTICGYFTISVLCCDIFTNMMECRLRYTKQDIEYYQECFGLIIAVTIVAMPAIVIAIDRYNHSIIFLIISFTGILWSLCNFGTSDIAMFTTIGLFSLFRSFINIFSIVYLMETAQREYFGMVVAIMMVISGIFVGIISIPFVEWITRNCINRFDEIKTCVESRLTIVSTFTLVSMIVLSLLSNQIRSSSSSSSSPSSSLSSDIIRVHPHVKHPEKLNPRTIGYKSLDTND